MATIKVTGGPDSPFAGLYVLLITATSLLMPPFRAALVTTLAGLAYVADVLFGLGTQIALGTLIQL